MNVDALNWSRRINAIEVIGLKYPEEGARFTNKFGPFRARPTHGRSLLKALSWLVPAGAANFLIVNAFVGDGALAAKIVGAEMVAMFALFYLHERFWTRYRFGFDVGTPSGDDPGI